MDLLITAAAIVGSVVLVVALRRPRTPARIAIIHSHNPYLSSGVYTVSCTASKDGCYVRSTVDRDEAAAIAQHHNRLRHNAQLPILSR